MTFFFQRWVPFGLRKTIFYFFVKRLIIFSWYFQFWRNRFTWTSINRILFCDNCFKKQLKLVFQIKWSLLIFWVLFFTFLDVYLSQFQRNCNIQYPNLSLQTNNYVFLNAWKIKDFLCIFTWSELIISSYGLNFDSYITSYLQSTLLFEEFELRCDGPEVKFHWSAKHILLRSKVLDRFLMQSEDISLWYGLKMVQFFLKYTKIYFEHKKTNQNPSEIAFWSNFI